MRVKQNSTAPQEEFRPHLDGQEIARLLEAIIKAFDRASLNRTLVENCGKELSHYAAYSDDDREAFFKLIRGADREGWLPQLLSGLQKVRPENRRFQRALDEFRCPNDNLREPKTFFQRIEVFLRSPRARRYLFGFAGATLIAWMICQIIAPNTIYHARVISGDPSDLSYAPTLSSALEEALAGAREPCPLIYMLRFACSNKKLSLHVFGREYGTIELRGHDLDDIKLVACSVEKSSPDPFRLLKDVAAQLYSCMGFEEKSRSGRSFYELTGRCNNLFDAKETTGRVRCVCKC